MMMKKLLSGIEKPFVQVAMLAASSLVAHLLLLLIMRSDPDSGHFYHWVISASILLLYAFFNAVYLLKTDQLNLYVRNALYGFIVLLLFTFGIATALSNVSEVDRRSVKWIFFTITFSYFIFLMIAYFMRKIIEYAQRQDTEANS
jgi:bacteriorhodopsin